MSLPFASKHHPHPNHQCDVENAIIGTGIGANKSEAENAAARATLSIIQ
jgi:dsRNA-specific ribonuclease